MKSFVRLIVAGAILCATPAFVQTASGADTNMEILKHTAGYARADLLAHLRPSFAPHSVSWRLALPRYRAAHTPPCAARNCD